MKVLSSGSGSTNAISDEIAAVRLALQKSFESTITELRSDLELKDKTIHDQLDKLRGNFDVHMENYLKDRKDDSVAAQNLVIACRAHGDEEINKVTSSINVFREDFKLLGARVYTNENEMRERLLVVDELLGHLGTQIKEGHEGLTSDYAKDIAATRTTFNKSLDDLSRNLTWVREAHEDLLHDFRTGQELQQQRHAELQEQAVCIGGDIRRGMQETFHSIKQLNDQLQEQSEAVQVKLGEVADGLETKVGDMLTETRDIRAIISEVENVNVRRVDWVIPNMSQRVGVLTADPTGPTFGRYVSVFSPRFEAAGTNNLQLELRLFRPEHVQAKGKEHGDCSLLLSATKGLFLVFNLAVGNHFAHFQHSFDGKASQGMHRECCFLENILPDDSLRVSFEILEASLQVENRGIWRAESARVEEGSLFSSRHMNHRIMDLVQDQVALMRSRMVRRIEWRIEHASILRRNFPEGAPLCSSPFEAAGVEGLQLIFYPSGNTGAREGHCSFYLYVPGSSTLRCWLWVGKQRREARVSNEQSGLLGRLSFCKFDNCMDTDDFILLVLEIEEAQQDVKSSLAHPLAKSASGDLNMSNDSQHISSTMRLQRMPGRVGLEDVKQLPPIWTPRPPRDIAAMLEGFHNMPDVRNVKQNSARAAAAPAVAGNHLGSSGESQAERGALKSQGHQPGRTNVKYVMYG